MSDPSLTILYDRTCCMFERTGTYRYIDHLKQSLISNGENVVSYQPYPDHSLGAGEPGRHVRILLSDFWHSRHLPLKLARGNSRVIVHHPVLPTRTTGLCNVISVLDLNVLHELGSFSRYNRILARMRLSQLKQADGIITISDFVKKDLLDFMPELDGRVNTVHLGLHMPVRDIPFAEKNRNVFLYVGGIGPNKNLLNAVWAFHMLHQKTGLKPEFRMIGPVIRPEYAEQVNRLIHELGMEQHIRLFGAVTDEELSRHYREAAFFIFYSAREGFGFPVLEAQANGCAVICSNATSLPEIGGHGCVYADPDQPDECAERMSELLAKPGLAADLIANGYRNVTRFSWEKCALHTADIYRAAYRRRHGIPPE